MAFDDSKVSFDLSGKSVGSGYYVQVAARYENVDCASGYDSRYFPFYPGHEAFKEWSEYAGMTFHARCNLRDALEHYDVDTDGIDPYDGDPRNEVADLATDFHITTVEECPGLKEDYVYAEWSTCGGGKDLNVSGPISWVLPILRVACGRPTG